MTKRNTDLISRFCYDIGCSGMDPKRCPGDPWCQIVIKMFGPPPKSAHAVFDPSCCDG